MLICQLLNVYSTHQISDRLANFILRARHEFSEIQTQSGGNTVSKEVLEVGGYAPFIEIIDILPNLFGDRKELRDAVMFYFGEQGPMRVLVMLAGKLSKSGFNFVDFYQELDVD